MKVSFVVLVVVAVLAVSLSMVSLSEASGAPKKSPKQEVAINFKEKKVLVLGKPTEDPAFRCDVCVSSPFLSSLSFFFSFFLLLDHLVHFISFTLLTHHF